MRRTWLIFSQAVTVGVALLFVVETLKPQWLQRPPPPASVTLPAASPAPLPTLAARSADFDAARSTTASYAAAARRATPSVVSITARKAPPRGDNGDPWFRFFFGDRAQSYGQPQVGLGSGVIVSADGYLLTNNHVIAGADDIEVLLADSRTATARLVGTDPDTDVAVLKIAVDGLPAISFANSEALQVGDVVLAIGNPFGVGQTVTSGIVSALGRDQLGINTFENFIQTDAAINPGNSGGALIDSGGALVGINTAIYSRSGGSLGIGFAIPAETARQVMASLIRDGQVLRGWIGVEPRDLTPEIVQALNLPIHQGVLITGVLQSGPAAAAGLRPGDVVVRVAGHAVSSAVQLRNAVAALKPREEAVLTVRRNEQQIELKVTIAQRPSARPQRPPQ